METARMTSKGQLVIPKKVRDAVRATPGTEFAVTVEGSRIVLEMPHRKNGKVGDWTGINPKGVRLTTAALCKPVELERE
jgi:AbrB family looped-hinge helix DNA binding protein